MAKRYVELSKRFEEDYEEKLYHYGTYCLENNSDVRALMQAAWEFGLYKINYHTEFIEKEDEDEADADN